MLVTEPSVLQADRNFAVVLEISLLDLFRAFQTVGFWFLCFFFIQELLKTKQTTSTTEPLELGNMVKNDQDNIKIYCYNITNLMLIQIKIFKWKFIDA